MKINVGKINNKGFTLIEMIVACAVVSIFTLAVFAFMTTSVNAFKSINTTQNLQFDGQVAMAQISEYTIDCNTSIEWKSADNTLAIKDTKDGNYEFKLQDKVLYLVDEGGTESIVVKNVSNFKVDINDIKTKTDDGGNTTEHACLADVTLQLSVGGKTHDAIQTLSLRNEPLYIH